MPLNKNQIIYLHCPQCGQDIKKSIKWLYKNSIVTCEAGLHDLSSQADAVIESLKNTDKILEQDMHELTTIDT